ncbi:MAG: hypothetical protein K0R12_534 [Gammaproteobacteria bacterium]|jgi:hypothetical protein|nr:hypothetical protein [Gammaproteobacteria bacterium]
MIQALKKSLGVLIIAAGCLINPGLCAYAASQDARIESDVAAFTQLNQDIDPTALRAALNVYYQARETGLDKEEIFTVIDYSKPSTQKRFWVLDMKNHQILFDELVAHGKNSGDLMATQFSNNPQSLQSSLGLFLTEGVYTGKHGVSLRLKGLSQGFNTNAYQRSVVIHGAPYVSESFVQQYGRLGRSWGCPALSQQLFKPTINAIKEGTLVYAYYPLPKLASARMVAVS